MKFQTKIVDVDKIFKDAFMKYFEFKLDDIIIKEGRLKLFVFKEFNMIFHLICENKEIKSFEIPYPFELIPTNDGYCFNYQIKSLYSLKDKSKIDLISEQSLFKHKLYDKKLYLKIT